ncbi:hypothetical protein SAMN05444392_1195 [Seinonella peptonophila]|uniref:Uncharacterized protein n=1 Tax=Seinonella peptonophila TaxID=112248 RepID=A0A1M5B704_9BACL|nr:hypothetical protein SAMN05444392_1195 [Seinonella peptonophila]
MRGYGYKEIFHPGFKNHVFLLRIWTFPPRIKDLLKDKPKPFEALLSDPKYRYFLPNSFISIMLLRIVIVLTILHLPFIMCFHRNQIFLAHDYFVQRNGII